MRRAGSLHPFISVARRLAAGNLSFPFALSRRTIHEDSDLLVALRVIAATPTELKRYPLAFQGQALSARNERKWRLLLRETVQALLDEAENETTLEQDRQIMLQFSGTRRMWTANSTSKFRLNTRGERRRREAVLCRLGEKMLLRQVLADLEEGLTQVPWRSLHSS